MVNKSDNDVKAMINEKAKEKDAAKKGTVKEAAANGWVEALNWYLGE